MVHFVEDGGEEDSLAPVTPIFGSRAPDARRPRPSSVSFAEVPAESGEPDDAAPSAPDPAATAAHAEKALVRRLATRDLSIAEARTFLRERDVAGEHVEALIAEFVDRRYLDDARVADQLVRIGAERKGQGRQVIAMTLSSRGIPRDIADAALDAMPDDEDERALAFARERARRFEGVDEQAALRRLLGQLARRGFSGHAATAAARTALAERGGHSRSGVRFS